MRVLVTGGTGFIGSHTAVALDDAGHSVRLLVRDPAKAERVFRAHGRAVPELAVGDVGDPASVRRAAAGCDALVHSAAVVTLQAARAREVLETNARAVETVVREALDAGVRRVVYVSSVGALFRPGGPQIGPDAPVHAGRTAYARSKAEAEERVRRWQDEGAPIRTTYPTAVVGPDDPGLSESNHAVRTFLKDTMVMTSSGFQLVDVRDLARVHVRLVERAEAPPRSLVAGHFFRWSELADLIDRITGARVRRIAVPGPLLRVAGRLGDQVKRLVPFDFPLTSEAMSFATRWVQVDDAATRDALGIRYRPALETLADTVAWLYRSGHLERRHVGRLADADGSGGAGARPALEET